MVRRDMSGEANQDEQKPPPEQAAPADQGAAGDVIPVEVEAPDPIKELEDKLASAEKEKKENWDRYLRAAADLENMRKRQRRELEDAKFDTKQKVLKEMLPVVDNLERALEHSSTLAEENEAMKPFVDGVQLVLRQFMTAFERLDVTPIDAMNQPFDPNLHEAISQQESDQPAGSIIQVLQRGYRAGDRLLRPSLVVVAKAKPQAEP